MRRSAAIIFSLYLSICFSGRASGELSATQRKENLDSFDRVWNTVREKHWDPALGGIDWNSVRNELRPKVEKAESQAEVRAILSDMLSRLHLTHYGVVPGAVYRDVEGTDAPSPEASAPDPEPFDEGTAGLDVRVLDGQAVVVSVERGASAERQGVRPGWIVKRVDGEDLEPVIRRVSSSYVHSTLRSMMLARAALSRLDGPLDNPVDVEFRDGHDHTVPLSLERKRPRGEPEKFGYMPESWFWIESKRPASDVAYVAFDYFLDPIRLTDAFRKSIDSCPTCTGMVIDVRGNPGGIGILAMGLAGFFIDKPDLKLGTLFMRNLPMNFVVNPRPPAFKGALAILIDGLSASTSEIFAGGLQDLKRARVFGSRSAGAALPSMFERLPNGDGFQYAMATYKSDSGKTLEGTGVTPDTYVVLSREALLAGHDPALEAAVQWIHKQALKGSTTP